jgi:hypothetical protein
MASNKGGGLLGMGEWTDDDLVTDVERPTPSAALVVNDWFWGGGAPDPIVIPWTWLVMPLVLRADQPINYAKITGLGGNTYTAVNTASTSTRKNFYATTTLDTISPDDAANFAQFLVTYYGNPLLRAPTFTMSLVSRTDEERWRILGGEIGNRFTLGTGYLGPGQTNPIPVPANLPAGARSLLIEGVEHDSSIDDWLVHWTTGPLLGSTPGVQGPWFRVDSSYTDGTDVMAF